MFSSQERIVLPSSISSQCYQWKKTTSEREATDLMDRCSIQTRTKEEYKAREEGAKRAKADTIKYNPGTKILQPTRRHECARRSVEKKGKKPCRTELTKQLPPVRILWQFWPLQGRMSQEEGRDGFQKSTTHKLRLQLQLQQSWQNVCDEAQSKLDVNLVCVLVYLMIR